MEGSGVRGSLVNEGSSGEEEGSGDLVHGGYRIWGGGRQGIGCRG